MCELASGLRASAREYRIRRSILLGLADLRCPIVPEGPEQKIRAAFRLLPPLPNDGRNEHFGWLGGLLRDSGELREFEASRDALAIVERFEMYDRTLATHFVSTTGDTHRDLRELWKQQPPDWRSSFWKGRLADYLYAHGMEHHHNLTSKVLSKDLQRRVTIRPLPSWLGSVLVTMARSGSSFWPFPFRIGTVLRMASRRHAMI